MKDGLYHKSLGFPSYGHLPFLGEIVVELSLHAREQRSFDDGIIFIMDQENIVVEKQDIVELEISGGRPVKAVIRLAYSDAQDICFVVLAPIRGRAVCKTVWLNSA